MQKGFQHRRASRSGSYIHENQDRCDLLGCPACRCLRGCGYHLAIRDASRYQLILEHHRTRKRRQPTVHFDVERHCGYHVDDHGSLRCCAWSRYRHSAIQRIVRAKRGSRNSRRWRGSNCDDSRSRNVLCKGLRSRNRHRTHDVHDCHFATVTRHADEVLISPGPLGTDRAPTTASAGSS